MNDLPPVTIGIPIYNCVRYLADALRSVFAQTHQDWELILVDDGSTDGSLDFIRALRDPRVRIFADGRNLGLAARLNQIADEARFGLIARMDGDDLCSPQRLERQLAVLAARPEVDVVSSGTYSMTSDGLLVGIRGASRAATSVGEVLAGKVGLVHAACIYCREWICRHRYNERVPRSEDLELWARSSAAGDLRAITIPDPLYIYREDLNITAKKLSAAYALEAALINRYSFGASWLKLSARNAFKRAIAHAANLPVVRRKMHIRRNPIPITIDTREEFATMLDRIRATPVPGLCK